MTSTTSTTTATTAAEWAIDPAHSHVEFAVRHLMISTVKGRFAGVAGTVRMNEADPADAAVHVTIDVASIDTREPQRDAHLRSADFFDVEKYPSLTFTSRRVDNRREGSFTLVGDLTLHGVTREVALEVLEEGRGKDPWGGERAGYAATTKIKRSDFGLTWNQVLEAGGFAVGDDIRISIDLELVKKQSA
jgi:polyisoprenoid-binding protein YceI